ncbi:amidohydrolase [Streptomyces purpureus]|uniref:Amidohydrolase n=2 Tax=Streptomyces purpureus TaxID=1951 RepID=A0A918H079_9ACTN|nr:amidohydrolase [Streptomyces purpureus]
MIGFCGGMATSLPSRAADLVFLDGTVVTVDREFTVATSLAVTGSVITAVGGRADVEPYIGPDTRVVDLKGATLLPGINDSHLHACHFGLSTPPMALDIAFPSVRSIADIAETVRAAAASAPAGQWLTGIGWDTSTLDECVAEPERLPCRADLDEAAPDHPVLLQDLSGHASWANSAALALAGIGPDTVAPPGGEILRDAQGEATGLLREGAQALVQQAVPALTPQVRADAIRSALAQLRALGITSFTEPGLGPGGEDMSGGSMGSGTLDAYRMLLAAGELTARVAVLLLPTGLSSTAEEFARVTEALVPAEDGADTRWLNVIGLKIFADGVPPNKTAWMHEPYASGGCGALAVEGADDPERIAAIREMVLTGHRHGVQLGIHVTGDRGIDTVVDALAAAAESDPRPDARHYLIHGDFLPAGAMKRLAALGYGVNMNPTLKWAVADMEEELVGAERAAYAWPYRDALDAGVTVTSSSDAPVTFPDWRQGVSTMMLRESRSGRVSGAGQRISLAEALRTYTADAAWQDFAEEWKGSLEVGKVADLCVLGGELLDADPREIPGMPVLLTVVDGRVVHDLLAQAPGDAA